MIRRILTTLFCAVSFFFLVFVIPVQAGHMFTTNFVCLTEEDGLEATKYEEAGSIGALFERANIDPNFACYRVKWGYSYYAIELIHAYMANGVRKGMILSFDANGGYVYTFGTMDYLQDILHQPVEQGA